MPHQHQHYMAMTQVKTFCYLYIFYISMDQYHLGLTQIKTFCYLYVLNMSMDQYHLGLTQVKNFCYSGISTFQTPMIRSYVFVRILSTVPIFFLLLKFSQYFECLWFVVRSTFLVPIVSFENKFASLIRR